MQICVNGEARNVTEGSNLEKLLDDLGVRARTVVVELNRDIVRFAQFESTVLKPGDEVEVVRIVGGGSVGR